MMESEQRNKLKGGAWRNTGRKKDKQGKKKRKERKKKKKVLAMVTMVMAMGDIWCWGVCVGLDFSFSFSKYSFLLFTFPMRVWYDTVLYCADYWRLLILSLFLLSLVQGTQFTAIHLSPSEKIGNPCPASRPANEAILSAIPAGLSVRPHQHAQHAAQLSQHRTIICSHIQYMQFPINELVHKYCAEITPH